jgi:hypothetical protein
MGLFGFVGIWASHPGGAGQLAGQGVTRETLRAGDIVVIIGNPGRNADNHRLRMVSLRRPTDGFEWVPRPARPSSSLRF